MPLYSSNQSWHFKNLYNGKCIRPTAYQIFKELIDFSPDFIHLGSSYGDHTYRYSNSLITFHYFKDDIVKLLGISTPEEYRRQGSATRLLTQIFYFVNYVNRMDGEYNGRKFTPNTLTAVAFPCPYYCPNHTLEADYSSDGFASLGRNMGFHDDSDFFGMTEDNLSAIMDFQQLQDYYKGMGMVESYHSELNDNISERGKERGLKALIFPRKSKYFVPPNSTQ